MAFNWIQRFIPPGLSIAQKIGYGYSVAIGMGVFGTTVGLAIGDYYQKQAGKQLSIAYEQQYLLSDLENSVLHMRAHPQRLVSVLGESIWFEYETAKFFEHVDTIKKLLLHLAEFKSSQPSEFATENTNFHTLLSDYNTATDAYTEHIESIWKQIDPPSLKPAEIAGAQQQLLRETSSQRATQLTVKFEQLSESLSKLIRAAETKQHQASEDLRKAETIRLQIIVLSMLLSTVISIVLGLYTSRAIARPIRWVSEVAQQVTEQANFQLVAPVLTDDEVGALAKSLNQMVQWMGHYTQELERSRQTLEQRVEERTTELSQTLHELKHTQAQLIQSEKMSSLGQMVAGLAHEINNPVNFIYGNLDHVNCYIEDLLNLVDLYQKEYPAPTSVIQEETDAIDLDFMREDLPKILASMKIGTDRIRQIILSLRNFSRLDENSLKFVNIHEGIESTLLVLNSRVTSDIKIIKQYGKLPFLECYPAQINQVFMNIIGNAIDALQEPGYSSDKEIIISTDLLENRTIVVRIIDNGPGIPIEIKEKLFDPFFTTKPVGKGTGLGLAIAYQVIAKHQGKIEVFSEPGKYTEFAILLPIKTPKNIEDRNAAA